MFNKYKMPLWHCDILLFFVGHNNDTRCWTNSSSNDYLELSFCMWNLFIEILSLRKFLWSYYYHYFIFYSDQIKKKNSFWVPRFYQNYFISKPPKNLRLNGAVFFFFSLPSFLFSSKHLFESFLIKKEKGGGDPERRQAGEGPSHSWTRRPRVARPSILWRLGQIFSERSQK